MISLVPAGAYLHNFMILIYLFFKILCLQVREEMLD